MKKYKLKKDLPTVRAGEVFVRKTNETMQVDMLHRVDSEDVFLSPSIDVDDIIDFNEWFEEVKEFEEWKPKEGEQYKHAGLLAGARIDTWRDTDYDEQALSIGNCYPLDTPDELIIKEQRLIPQAMRRLKVAAKKAWFEFNGSDGPDWEDGGQEKWYVYYSHGDREFTTSSNYFTQRSILPSFPTRSSCRTYIHNNKDDLKLLFGVE